MKVSVIIPVYNAERFLERCLDSVFASADRLLERIPDSRVEVVCVDDGSSDGSLGVLRAYERPVVVLSQPNRGQGMARNLGLAHATGDYVAFVDSDDFIPVHALEFLVRAACESALPMVSSMSFAKDVAVVSEPVFRWRRHPVSWMAGKKVQYSVCGKLFRRDVLQGLAFLPCVFEDFAYVTEALCGIGAFAAITDPLYVYCSNAGSVSTIRSKLTPDKIEASFTVMRHVLEWVRGKAAERFAMRQVADGLSSTVGQVYKAHEPALRDVFWKLYDRFAGQYPAMSAMMSLKARYRLWRLSR